MDNNSNQTTPVGMGRGKRDRIPTTHLNYSTLGNPTDVQGQPILDLRQQKQKTGWPFEFEDTPSVHDEEVEMTQIPVPKPRSNASIMNVPLKAPVPKPRSSKASTSSSRKSTKEKKIELASDKEDAKLAEQLILVSSELSQVRAEGESTQKRFELLQMWKSSGTLIPALENEYQTVTLRLIEKAEQANKLEIEYEKLKKIQELRQPLRQREKEIQKEENGFSQDDDSVSDDEEARKRTEEWAKQINLNTQLVPPIKQIETSEIPFQGSQDGMNSMLVQLMQTQMQLLQQQTTKSDNIIVKSHLDKELPIFSGKAEEWPIFATEYDRTTIKYKYDNVENAIRLRKCLKGSARKLVMGLLDDPDSVDQIIKTLKNHFGRPEHILEELVQKVKDVKPPDEKNTQSFIEFSTVVRNLVTRVKSLQEDNYLNDVSLLKELLHKLPVNMGKDWIKWIANDKARKKNIYFLSEWLEEEITVLVQIRRPKVEDDAIEEKRAKRNRHFGAASGGDEVNENAVEKREFCYNCKLKSHSLGECRKFAVLPLEDKFNIAKSNGLCFNCLRRGHMTRECRSQSTCSVASCGRKHHTTLHMMKNMELEKKEDDDQFEEIETGEESTVNVNVNRSGCDELLWYVPIKIRGPKGIIEAYAMLDTGAQLSLIDEAEALKLGLTGKRESLNIGVFNGKENKQKSMILSLEVAADHLNPKFYKMENVRSLSNLDLPTQSYDVQTLRKRFHHLKGAPLKSQHEAKPILVIGTDNWNLIFPRHILEGSRHDPAAIKTRLGWTLIGCGGRSVATRKGFFVMSSNSSEDDMNRTIKEFICMDSFGVVPNLNTSRSKEDKRAQDILTKTTVKIGSRWSTGLLWRNENEPLPESKSMALKRLYTMERKMDRDDEFASLYTSRINEYIQKGYLVPVQPKANQDGRKWYLPHFFAFHQNKKPRLVFDAAAKSHGRSFNDFLMKGPDLLQSLPSVLMRFRLHNVAISGDIREMFHQVRLRKEDQPSQTILYRGMDRIMEPQEYAMTVLFFGSACSPCSAIYVKDRNAEEYEDDFPSAVKAIVRDTYMDDFLSGGKTEDEAIQLRHIVTKIHENGGFPIAKWSSSSIRVLESVPESLRICGDRSFTIKSDLPIERTLGLLWNQAEDSFRFELNWKRIPEGVKTKERHPTKREIASFTMSLFDPLGFLTPLKIKGLIIFQNTWGIGLGWDDEIPSDLNRKWDEWIQDLEQINEVKISRIISYDIHKATDIQLHVMCDASLEAYAAAAYLRVQTGGSISVTFIAGKGRLAPLKGLTIPRMELNAALMAARLSKKIQETYADEISINKYVYWSDNRTVLCWIKSEMGRFSQYVSNRVNEILECTRAEEWNWVSTTQNSADDATRSNSPIEFHSNCRWLRGPRFLEDDEYLWPKEDATVDIDENELEIRKVFLMASQAQLKMPLPNVTDFSCWWSLLTKTAKWIRSARRIQKLPPDHVTVNDYKRAEILWMRQVQIDHFEEELQLLANGRSVQKSSRLRNMTTTLNMQGLIVLSGRLESASFLSESMKNPVILDPRHPYTILLIEWHHRSCSHQGQEVVMSELRKRYWILSCRNAVRRCIAKCGVCKIRRANPIPPLMGQIPDARITPFEPPFTRTGIDLFGPYTVAIGRRNEKRWGILYTCMCTRAVYIDLIPSLSTSDFIDALVRFNSRRGPAKHIYCDNATNFRGASKEIRKQMEDWKPEDIRNKMLQSETEWHFIPPASPHMGGSWERLIGIAKRILDGILMTRTPKEYTLITLLVEVENMMNSRPLTAVSPDPLDPEALTPNHLLKLRCVPQPLPGEFMDAENHRKMWRIAQKLSDEFWIRWKKEYLPNLAKRNKWIEPVKPLQIGDIVLLLDDQAKRNSWKKGVVVKTFPGKDGQVRVADVRVPIVTQGEQVKFTVYRRPTVKLCPIGVNVNDKTTPYGREKCY